MGSKRTIKEMPFHANGIFYVKLSLFLIANLIVFQNNIKTFVARECWILIHRPTFMHNYLKINHYRKNNEISCESASLVSNALSQRRAKKKQRRIYNNNSIIYSNGGGMVCAAVNCFLHRHSQQKPSFRSKTLPRNKKNLP